MSIVFKLLWIPPEIGGWSQLYSGAAGVSEACAYLFAEFESQTNEKEVDACAGSGIHRKIQLKI